MLPDTLALHLLYRLRLLCTELDISRQPHDELQWHVACLIHALHCSIGRHDAAEGENESCNAAITVPDTLTDQETAAGHCPRCPM